MLQNECLSSHRAPQHCTQVTGLQETQGATSVKVNTKLFTLFFAAQVAGNSSNRNEPEKKVCFLSLPVKFPITTKINISLWMETFSRVILAPQFPRALESNSREKSLEMQHKMLVKKSRLFGGRDKSRRNSRVNATMCSMY